METKTNFKLKNGEITSAQALKWFHKTKFTTLPPYFLTHWKTKKYFFYFEDSLLAFEKTRTQFIITGEPASIETKSQECIYKAFLDFAHNEKKKVCGFYVGKSWENTFFTKQPLGTSFRLDLNSFDLESSKAKEVRRSLRKGKSNKYKVITAPEIDFVKLKSLLEKWRTKKLPIKLKLFLSEPQKNSPTAEYEKWYVIEKNDQYYAFCSTLPYSFKNRGGLYIDHLVYDPSSEKSALSFLISSLIQNSKENETDVQEINLGLNPFAEIEAKGFVGRLFSCLYLTPFLYRPKGLHYFKSKFGGQEESEFFFYEKNSSSITSLLGMMKTSFKRTSQKV